MKFYAGIAVLRWDCRFTLGLVHSDRGVLIFELWVDLRSYQTQMQLFTQIHLKNAEKLGNKSYTVRNDRVKPYLLSDHQHTRIVCGETCSGDC